MLGKIFQKSSVRLFWESFSDIDSSDKYFEYSAFEAEFFVIGGSVERPISNIHIYVKQRNSKKTNTIIEGFASDLDLNKIAKALRKYCNVMCNVIYDEKKERDIIKMSGDQRYSVYEFLMKYHVWEEPDSPIKIHGF